MSFNISLSLSIAICFTIYLFFLLSDSTLGLISCLGMLCLLLYQIKQRIGCYQSSLQDLILFWEEDQQEKKSFEHEEEMNLCLCFENLNAIDLSELSLRLESSHELLIHHSVISLPKQTQGRIIIPISIEHIVNIKLWGVSLFFQHKWLGWKINRFYPMPLTISVLPKKHAYFLTENEIKQSFLSHQNSNLPRSLRIQKEQDELKELKEYQQGDPLARVVWKAFAKSQKLIVKAYESINESKVAYLIDINEEMHAPIFGIQPIDYAIEDCYATLLFLLKKKDSILSYVGCFSTQKEELFLCNSPQQALKALCQFQQRYSKAAADCPIAVLEEKIAYYAQNVWQISLFKKEIFDFSTQQMSCSLVDQSLLQDFLKKEGFDLPRLKSIRQSNGFVQKLAPQPEEELLRLYCASKGIHLPFTMGKVNLDKVDAIINFIHWGIQEELKMLVLYTTLTSYSEGLMKALLSAKKKNMRVLLLHFGKIPGAYFIKKNVFEYKIIKLFEAKASFDFK